MHPVWVRVGDASYAKAPCFGATAANMGLMKMFHRLFLEEAQSMLPVLPCHGVMPNGMLCIFDAR